MTSPSGNAAAPGLDDGPVQKSTVPSVVRACRVLDLVAQSPTPLSLGEIARALALPKSSLHGLCATLVQLGLIHRNQSGHMGLGPHVMSWAHAFAARSDIAQAFAAAWENTILLKDESVTLSVLDGAEVVYIAARCGARPLGVAFRIGMRLPAPFTSSGKVMLGTRSDDEVRSLLSGKWPEPLTQASTPDLPTLLEDLAGVRTAGYSTDRGEVRSGMCCYSAPVFDADGKRAVAGVAVSMLSHEVTSVSQEKAIRGIRELASDLSRRLGASGGRL